ncbi:MFS transporter [Plantactinospora sp. GCM10030261]|uniref:MFS transporter n=1 Tax=Plantactinospora sp. GCM10030261 TaxID=3273420 RepID=UPI003609D196
MAVSAFFFVNGVAWASWYARIPDVKHRLDLSDGALGAALFVAAAGTVLGLLWVGRIVDRHGSRTVGRIATVLVALGPIGPGIAPNIGTLMAALLVFGLAGGVFNVAMNAQAVLVEHRYGRPIIASFHATYSAGGLLGAALGGLAIRLDFTPAAAFVVVGATLTLLSLLTGRNLLPGSPQDKRPEETGRGRRPAPLGIRVLILGMCCFACLMAEGVIADWSAVYLRNELLAPAEAAAAGFLVFSVAMATTRLAGDALVTRLGPVRLVQLCALFSASGLTLGLFAQHWLAAVLGLGLFGVGLSCITPQLFRAAGNESPQVMGRAIARVATLGYFGLLTGPALIGLAAQALSLRWALGIVVIFMIGVALLYPLAERGPAKSPQVDVPR